MLQIFLFLQIFQDFTSVKIMKNNIYMDETRTSASGKMYKKFETRHKNMVKAYQHNNWTLDQSFKLLNSRGKNV